MMPTRLKISLPRCRAHALRWVCDFLFKNAEDSIEIEEWDNAHIEIAAKGNAIRFQSEFPNLGDDRAVWHRQLPVEPLARFSDKDQASFDLPTSVHAVPVLYGRPAILEAADGMRVEADLFGGIFFLLSRFEEIVSDERDLHDRFPGVASIAHRECFLEMPLADIYSHIIWALISHLWPSIRMPRPVAQKIDISCDVDEPFDNAVLSPYLLIRSLGADILNRRSPSLALQRSLNYALRGLVGPRFDPCYTFDWYMDLCEANSLIATFYFIAGHSAGKIDGTYQIDEPRMLDLLRKITRRGHKIGMHGSYNTFRDANALARERQALNLALDLAGLDIDVTENRQHYLRWDTACTPDNLASAGFKTDTTGGFADRPGYRYGTARPFPMWSWQKLQSIGLVQKPLIVMEVSLLSGIYLGLDETKASNYLAQLQKTTKIYGGQFSILWHNSSLKTQREKSLFGEIIQNI